MVFPMGIGYTLSVKIFDFLLFCQFLLFFVDFLLLGLLPNKKNSSYHCYPHCIENT